MQILTFSYLLTICFTCMALQPSAHANEPARKVISDWISAQKNVNSLEVDFVQDRKLRGLKKPLRSNGKFWLSKPDKMRWQVGDPVKTLAIYSGDLATVIKPEKNEYRQQKSGTSEESGEAERTFLQSGLPDSLEAFEKFAKIGETKQVEFNESLTGVELTLLDKKAASAVDSLILFIDEKNQLLAGYEIKFRDGSEVLTRFSKINSSPTLNDALFTPETSNLKQVPWDTK